VVKIDHSRKPVVLHHHRRYEKGLSRRSLAAFGFGAQLSNGSPIATAD